MPLQLGAKVAFKLQQWLHLFTGEKMADQAVQGSTQSDSFVARVLIKALRSPELAPPGFSLGDDCALV
jgi:hypothetical protein